ncbi:MAG: type II secretion system protein N, partial [Pseudomonadales bacterium]
MDEILELATQHSQKLATLVSVIAVILIGLSIANAVLFVIDNIDDSIALNVDGPVASLRQPGSDRVNLSELKLFGVAEADDEVRVVNAPQTNLNLELQGVFTAADPDDSTAIVAERNKTGELYQIGDRLPGNAILDAVFDDHILIKRGIRLEKLMFSDASVRQQFSSSQNPGSVGTSGPASSVPSPTRLQNLRERIEARRATSQPPPTESIASGNLRDYLTNYRERINEDPQKVLNEIGVAPVTPGE